MMKKLSQIPEKTIQAWVYLVVIPMTIAAGVGAVVSAVLVQQEAGMFFVKVFAGLVGFLAIYSIQISKAISWKKKDDE